MSELSKKWLSGFKSYKDWYKSLERRSRTGKVSTIMRSNYDSAIRQLVKFFRSGEDKKADPDSILEWARSVDADGVVDMLCDFEMWLLGQDVEGYEKRELFRNERFLNPKTAGQKAHGSARGFFTHNRMWLPKAPKRDGSGRGVTKKNDVNYAIFMVDPDTSMVVQDYTLFRQFLSNLSFRDQTIALCILSTSQDSGDLLQLKLKNIASQENKVRLYWEGKRNKTGEEFRTFISKEATRFLRQYIVQERKGADPEEPIFVRTGGVKRKKNQPLLPRNLSDNFSVVAQKMSLLNGEAQNPFRPKRLRSIFSSACYQAKIDEGVRHIFMGHSGSISEKYRELPAANLELIYAKVEMYLTVYPEDRSQELVMTKKKSQTALDLALDLRDENKQLREMVEQLRRDVAAKMGEMKSMIEQLGLEQQRGYQQSTEVLEQIDSGIVLWDQIESKEGTEPSEDVEAKVRAKEET